MTKTCDHLEIKTKAGTFFADVETEAETSHNSICLSFRPKGFEQAADIAAIRDMPVGGDPEGIEMLLFDNLASEDETVKTVLTREKILEQMQERECDGTCNPAETENQDSRPAREFVAALPVELSRDEWIALLTDFIQRQFVADGMCADVCIHDTDGHNPHAHIMLTVRPLDEREKIGAVK